MNIISISMVISIILLIIFQIVIDKYGNWIIFPKFQFLFKYYDFWVGFFWDSKKKWLYFLPIPMFGVIIKFEE